MYKHCSSYDSDKSGAIDKKEMTRVMKSVYAMLGTKGSEKSSLDEKVHTKTLCQTLCRFNNNHSKATAHAARLFKNVDVDGDGELNEKEFLEVFILHLRRQRIPLQNLSKVFLSFYSYSK